MLHKRVVRKSSRRELLRDGALVLAALTAVAFGLRRRTQANLASAASQDAAATGAPPGTLPLGASGEPAQAATGLVDSGCDFPDQGNGDYSEDKRIAQHRAWLRPAAVSPGGGYRLLLFFHGGEAARRLLCPLGLPLIIVTSDRGNSSSAYRGSFPNRKAVDTLIAEVDAAVSAAAGRPARADRIAVAAFSAGYQALTEFLAASGEEAAPSAVILLDSLHASYRGQGPELEDATLTPFVEAALRALTDSRFFFALSHSSIRPPGYASTSEVADFLLTRLKVDSDRIERPTTSGFALTRLARERGFLLRGYAGQDAAAHCAQLGLLPEFVRLWLER